MSDIAIRVEKLSKRYRIGGSQEPYQTLRDTLTEAATAPFRRIRHIFLHNGNQSAPNDNTIWALKDVCFEVRRGEVVGIIGCNGAGKSTLLKILSRITEPTSGFVDIRGRVGSLLEVGTGFHLELTGRENIYLNGAILGMRKAEIQRKFDEIVGFAEVEKFIDTPVKHYSTGMYLRLAFAVAAHLEPEILVVDEVLAVGDAAFQKKCLGKMGDVAKEGRTVLFVSHNMGAITQLCTRALWVDRGQIKVSGPAFDVVGSYLCSEASNCSVWEHASNCLPGTLVGMKSAQILTADNGPTTVVRFDKGFKIEITYEVAHPVRNLFLLCRLADSQGNIIWTSWDTDTTGWSGRVREPGAYRSICKVPGGLLRPGRYLVSVGANNMAQLDYYENVLAFDVSQIGYNLNLNRMGVITPVLDWEVETEGHVI